MRELAPVLVGSALALQGCALYDGIFGQEKLSQQRVAAERAPAALHERGDGTALYAAKKAARVRVLATPRYAAQVVDWRHQFDGVVRDANATLRADLDLEIGTIEYRVWAGVESEDSLSALLARLEAEDAGDGVDWVIALATAVPGLAETPDQLGLATTPGKHVVIRAMSDPEEFDAIERQFTELSADERQKLYVARKRHKSAVVLLHELGHTLGLDHEQQTEALMNARYSHKTAGFSQRAAALAKSELARRSQAAPAAGKQAPVATPALNTVAATSAPSTSDDELAPLGAGDRRLFHTAVAARDARNLNEAWRVAEPLWSRHRSVVAVQKLRCDLATGIGGSWERIRAECDDFMKVSASPKP